jgi:hypothetical protein
VEVDRPRHKSCDKCCIAGGNILPGRFRSATVRIGGLVDGSDDGIVASLQRWSALNRAIC